MVGERLICTTSPDVPEWVIDRASRLGVRFQALQAPTDTGTPSQTYSGLISRLPRSDVAAQLERWRPDGYLLNGPPDYGPYFDGELADAAGNLKLVTYFGQSLEPAEYAKFLDVEALRQRGIAVTTTPSATESVAEGTLALLLALNLGLLPHNAARKAGTESSVTTRSGLLGSTLGIVGMGQIGRRVAHLSHALGMNVLYASRTRTPDVERSIGARFTGLADLFAESDHVSIHTPSSVTEGLINDEVLSNARGLNLINTTSVPRIVDPEALLNALDDERVVRAAIEGAYAEPYDQRLRTYGDNRVLLLPAYTSWDTEQSWNAVWKRYLETLTAFVSGSALPYQLSLR